jgi:cytochrome c-type biogenesis protein CcmF
LAGGTLLWILGIRHLYAFIAFVLSFLVTATIVQEFYRGVKARRQSHLENPFVALGKLLSRNQRRYAGYVVHFGIVLIFVGIAGTAFETRLDVTLAQGESFTIGRFKVEYSDIASGRDAAKEWVNTELHVFVDEKPVTTLRPEKRLYTTHEQPSTEVALHSTWRDDLYIVLAAFDYEKKQATFSAHVNPLVRWLWVGGWVMAIGTILALIPLTPDDRRATSSATKATRRRKEQESKPVIL